MGYFHNDSRPDPAEGSKWADPTYVASVGESAPYMPYAAGPFYALSQPGIAHLGRSGASGFLRTDWKNEDVTVGQWMHGTAAHRSHEEGILRYLEGSSRNRNCLPFALHMQSYQEELPREQGRPVASAEPSQTGAQRAVRGVHGVSSGSGATTDGVTSAPVGIRPAGYRQEQGGQSRWERDEWLAEVADAVWGRVWAGGLLRGTCCGE